MDRLTERSPIGRAVMFSEHACSLCAYSGEEVQHSTFCENVTCAATYDRTCPYLMVIDRLAMLEDILYTQDGTQRITLEELKELVNDHEKTQRNAKKGTCKHLILGDRACALHSILDVPPYKAVRVHCLEGPCGDYEPYEED